VPAKLRVESLPIRSLSADPANLRVHGDRSIDGIKASLRRFGQRKPIVVDGKGVVRAGNGILAAAMALGWTHVDAVRLPLKGVEATAFAIADNRVAELSEWAPELGAMLRELQAEDADLFVATGFTDAELGELLDAAGLVTDGATDPDAIPAPPDQPITRAGDLIELGVHRLLCGNAASAQDMARLMQGARADCLWTDPPYGVRYEGKTARRLRFEGDDPEGLGELLRASFATACAVLEPGAAIYIAHPAGRGAAVFCEAFLEAGWVLHQTLVWRKDVFVLGHSDYHYQHEPILYGHAPAKGRRGRGGAGWYGDNAQSSVFDVPRPRASELHPTAKPIELIEIALRNSTQRGDLVLDCFGGSGSTLIAAHRLARQARLLELDPAYCDVIVQRFEEHTGIKAKRPRAKKGTACA